MSTFLAKSFETIVAYEPGEQLGDDYLKLNANESSQEPSPRVLEVLKNAQTLNYAALFLSYHISACCAIGQNGL